jgi:hypothetical protein
MSKYVPAFSKTASSFLNPIEELELKDAVEARKRKITLGGRDYRIEYRGERIWLQVTKGLVPCGEFLIERLGDFE